MLVLIPATGDGEERQKYSGPFPLEMSVRKLVAEATHRLPGNSLNFLAVDYAHISFPWIPDYIANTSKFFIKLAKQAYPGKRGANQPQRRGKKTRSQTKKPTSRTGLAIKIALPIISISKTSES